MSNNDDARSGDTAFDPQPTYNFEDETMQNMSTAMTGRSGKRNAAAMFDTSSHNSFPSCQDMGEGHFHGSVAPSSLARGSDTDATRFMMSAAWPDGGRPIGDGVMKRFGQITPPDDKQFVHSDPSSAGSDSVVKSERARNAANQRHQKARHDSKDVTGEQSGEEKGEGGERKERYREKNRQAAAKCRDKKKKNTEQLDKKYKVVAAENAARKQDVRMLRDEFCRIRELALEHAPEQCTCSSLHTFNMQQAVKEASQMARNMGDMPMMDSSNHGRYGSDVTSPDSAGTHAHGHAFPDPAMGLDYAPGDIDFR